jgi:hypothetical protein
MLDDLQNPFSLDTDPRTAELERLSFEPLVARVSAAYTRYHETWPLMRRPEATAEDHAAYDEILAEFHACATVLDDRVGALLEDLAPRLFEALSGGTPEALAGVVVEFRALPEVARKFLFVTYLRDRVYTDYLAGADDVQVYAVLDCAIDRRRRLVESRETARGA